MNASSEMWLATVSVVVAIAVSHTFLYRELVSVRERLAKLEGAIEGFFARERSP